MTISSDLPFNKLSVGTQVSLITAAQFRYEGTVAAINSVEGTLILQKVTYWGGENRISSANTSCGPAVGSVFDSITFWMSNIIQLSQVDNDGIKDQAVVKTSSNLNTSQTKSSGDTVTTPSTSDSNPGRQRSRNRRNRWSKKSTVVQSQSTQKSATTKNQTNLSTSRTSNRQQIQQNRQSGAGDGQGRVSRSSLAGGGSRSGQFSSANLRNSNRNSFGPPNIFQPAQFLADPRLMGSAANAAHTPIPSPHSMMHASSRGGRGNNHFQHQAGHPYYQQFSTASGMLALGPCGNGSGLVSPTLLTNGAGRRNGEANGGNKKIIDEGASSRRRYNTGSGQIVGPLCPTGPSGAPAAAPGMFVCLPAEMAAAAVTAFQQQNYQNSFHPQQQLQYYPYQQHQAATMFGSRKQGASRRRLGTNNIGSERQNGNFRNSRRRGQRRNYKRQSGGASEAGIDCMTPYDFESANAQLEAELAKLTLSDAEDNSSTAASTTNEATLTMAAGSIANATSGGAEGDAASCSTTTTGTTTRTVIKGSSTGVPTANGASGDSSAGAVTSTGVVGGESGIASTGGPESQAGILQFSLSKGEYYDREKSFFDRISRVETHGRTASSKKRSDGSPQRAASSNAAVNTSGNGSATVGSTTGTTITNTKAAPTANASDRRIRGNNSAYIASVRRERKLNLETFGELAARRLSFGPRYRYQSYRRTSSYGSGANNTQRHHAASPALAIA